MVEEQELQKGLGYQAIKLEARPITNKDTKLYYPKDAVDKIFARLKERLAYLSRENTIRQRKISILKLYEHTMQKNKIYSPFDLEKHFQELGKKK